MDYLKSTRAVYVLMENKKCRRKRPEPEHRWLIVCSKGIFLALFSFSWRIIFCKGREWQVLSEWCGETPFTLKSSRCRVQTHWGGFEHHENSDELGLQGQVGFRLSGNKREREVFWAEGDAVVPGSRKHKATWLLVLTGEKTQVDQITFLKTHTGCMLLF